MHGRTARQSGAARRAVVPIAPTAVGDNLDR